MANAATDLPDAPDDDAASPGDALVESVEALLRDHWGLSGQIFPVEDGRGTGFLIDNGHLRYLLEIRSTEETSRLRIEHDVMRHVIRSPDGPPVPEPVSPKEGPDLVAVDIDGEQRLLRLLTVLDGDPPPISPDLSDTASASLGTLAALLARSLEDLDLTAWDGEHEDELRKAGPRTVSLLSHVNDQERRDFIARTMVAALRRIHPLTPGFRLGLTLPDLPLDDLVGEATDDGWHATGITDLGALAKSWYVSALSRTCARVLVAHAGEPRSILAAVRAYHAAAPLNRDEIEALWPLVMAEIALMAAIAESSYAETPDDHLALSEVMRSRQCLGLASSVTAPFMHAAILDACGIEPTALEFGPLLDDIDAERIRLVDLGVTSPLFHDGNWTNPDCDFKLLARIAWDTGMGSTRYGEYRLSRSGNTDVRGEPENVALHVDLCLPAGTAVLAPFAGTLVWAASQLKLHGRGVTLLLEGIASDITDGTEIVRGAQIGSVAGDEGAVGGLRVRLSRDPEKAPPLFCSPSQAGLWRHLSPSPSAILGLDCDAPAVANGEIVRTWREFAYNEEGHILLDFSSSAPMIGHGHPAIATASYRQHLLTNAPSENGPASDALKAALAEIAPQGLTRITLFPDRRTAMDAIIAVSGNRAVAVDDADEGEAGPLPQGHHVIIEPSPNIPDLESLADTARSEGKIIVMDETRTGFGRLGDANWGFEQQDLKADIVLCGPADGGRLAIVFSDEEMADELASATSSLSPVELATAHAALAVLIADELRSNATDIGKLLGQRLRQLADEIDAIDSVEGNGLLWIIQLTSENHALVDRLRGQILHDPGGPGEIILAPPLCLGEKGVDLLIERLGSAFGARRITAF